MVAWHLYRPKLKEKLEIDNYFIWQPCIQHSKFDIQGFRIQPHSLLMNICNHRDHWLTLQSDKFYLAVLNILPFLLQLMEGLPTLLVEDTDVTGDKMASTSSSAAIQLPLRKRGRQTDFKQEGGEAATPALFWSYTDFTLIYFHQKSISLSLNAELDDSSKSMAHLPIVKRLAGQFPGVCSRC